MNKKKNTQMMVGKILQLLQQNPEMSEAQAAEAAGVDRSTLFAWLAKGRSGNPEYASLYQAIAALRAKDVAKGYVGGPGTPKARYKSI
jgi:transcriptional regulator with XRE-family HTH domain